MNSGRQKPETACCARWNRPVFARYRYHPQPQRSVGNAPGSAFEGLAQVEGLRGETATMDAEVADLEDRLRILDALCTSPPAIPVACRKVLPSSISASCKTRMLSAMPVRLLTQSVLRWPQAPASAALAPGRLPLSCDALVL
ncbi:MAG: hypothetical protein RLZZ274_2080 [Cyanobacteriota bacterium]